MGNNYKGKRIGYHIEQVLVIYMLLHVVTSGVVAREEGEVVANIVKLEVVIKSEGKGLVRRKRWKSITRNAR